MLELVVGDKRNPLATNRLLSALERAPWEGTLYLGYPVIAAQDSPVFVDGLLTTLQHGVVVFDLRTYDGAEHLNAIRETQDDLYAAVYRKLYEYKPLRKGRELSIPINVVTVLPSEAAPERTDDLLIADPTTVLAEVEQLPSIEPDQLRLVNASIQRITTIKPLNKRASVTKTNSRGAIMKRIEQEIANLDQWQKAAAIESLRP